MTGAQINQVILDIRGWLGDYFKANRLCSAVLGMSGGLDSTIVAALARPACDAAGIPLLGLVIPIEQKPAETMLGALAAGTYCNLWTIQDLTTLYRQMKKEFLEESFTWSDASKYGPTCQYREQSLGELARDIRVQCGNMKARLRMIRLYNVAGSQKGVVLSTDNYSEYLAGFWSLHGDVGDLCPIQKIYKSELYEMAEVMGLPRNIIEATPTDGLGVSNSDMDQLGFLNYIELDKAYQGLSDVVSNQNAQDLITKTAWKRANPRILERTDIGLE